jgi:hypothetical protein
MVFEMRRDGHWTRRGLGDPHRALFGLAPSVFTCSRPEHHHHKPPNSGPTMASKDNIADGLMANGSFRAPSQSPKKAALSPKKTARKTRSKSIGPGGLGELEAPSLKALKESTGNRRKVCACIRTGDGVTDPIVCLHPRGQVDPGLER